MTHADHAARLVLGDRNAAYGLPAADFSGVAHIWTGLLNEKLKTPITKEEVALMMVGLKLRRHTHKPKDDNLIDAHGYLLTLEWIEKGAQPVPKADEATATIEDVCTGMRITCDGCGKPMPCLCEHNNHTSEQDE